MLLGEMISGHQLFLKGIADRSDTELAATTHFDYLEINAPPAPPENKNDFSTANPWRLSVVAIARLVAARRAGPCGSRPARPRWTEGLAESRRNIGSVRLPNLLAYARGSLKCNLPELHHGKDK